MEYDIHTFDIIDESTVSINNITTDDKSICTICLGRSHPNDYVFTYNKLFKEYSICSITEIKIPTTLDEALESREKFEWLNALDNEYKSMLENKVWDLVEYKEKYGKPIKCKTVFH